MAEYRLHLCGKRAVGQLTPNSDAVAIVRLEMTVTAIDLPTLRAAYSDRTAALMSNLARLAYDFPPPSCTPGPGLPVPDAFAALGFERITYFHNGLDDGWAYIVEGPTIVVVAFRGTRTAANWKTNFNVRMRHPEGTDPQLFVHEGFLTAFNALSDGADGIGAVLRRIEGATPPSVPIYFTGHSLGGALAQIATAKFGSDRVAACYTFGSPRVGSAFFDLWVKPPSYRVVNYADLVPQIPLFGPALPLRFYRHSGDPRYLPEHDNGSLYRYQPGTVTRLLQVLKGVLQLLRSGSVLGIEDHACTQYESKLASIARSRSQAR